ncbi:hypothetical protein DFH94DRAFT_79678 [Russula ochroleuca]|uniref:Uncharacterized protein n=1 Tax=Russula ochroleuca TaxID=152965 RepID=A0A9P5MSY0_9AGAM|nr:hypothetical protein DFH94DRAFT_79678 [Russula ochroleuca]
MKATSTESPIHTSDGIAAEGQANLQGYCIANLNKTSPSSVGHRGNISHRLPPHNYRPKRRGRFSCECDRRSDPRFRRTFQLFYHRFPAQFCTPPGHCYMRLTFPVCTSICLVSSPPHDILTIDQEPTPVILFHILILFILGNATHLIPS